MEVEVVIFGGGAAGLWLLDELVRRGTSVVLLEAGELGRGQTVAAQGIIHGGLKYTLQGLLTRSAAQIREMPLIWRECLAGRREPNLSGTRVRSQFCYLWRTDSVSSRLGMIGARFGLRIAPEILRDDERPAVLARCPGTVARLDEQVISTPDLLADLAGRHQERLLRIDAEAGCAFEIEGPGCIRALHLTEPGSGERLTLRPGYVVFTAGAGNAELRRRSGLSSDAMQRRPLHMVLLRGDLPQLNGHCVDGATTRVTITSDTDSAGRTVWQVGGQIAEEGVAWDAETLIERARTELESVIPGIRLAHAQWAAYRVDRAEEVTATGVRPDSCQLLREGNTITAWPTKLALVPRLASEIVAAIGGVRSENFARESRELARMTLDRSQNAAAVDRKAGPELPPNWPRPSVALPPWEARRHWYTPDRADSPVEVGARAA